MSAAATTQELQASGDDLASLWRATHGDFPGGSARAQLELTWQDVAGYRQRLFARARRAMRGFTSRLDGSIDLFHDLVEVHTKTRAAASRLAFVHAVAGEALRGTSFERLEQQSTALSSMWVERGVVPGDAVSLVAGPGLQRAVGLLAGLRLGAKMSLVEPNGRTYVRNRIRWLAPSYVAGEDGLQWYGCEQPTLPITCTRGVATTTAAHRYAPDEVALSFVSPFGPAVAGGAGPVCELTAVDCMARWLTDILLLMPVAEGEKVAAIGRSREVMEPCLWLAVLLAGGTFVDLELDVCRQRPELLASAGVNLLFVSNDMVPLLLRRPDLCSSLKRWSFDPSAALAVQPLWALAERLSARGATVANLVYSAPFGGCVAFSPRALRLQPLRVLPTPGLSFCLHDVGGSGAAVPVDHGVLAAEGCSEAQLGGIMLAANQQAYSISGGLRPRVAGRCYPEQEVEMLACSHPAVAHAKVIVVADRDVMNDGCAHLLLFVAPYHAAATAGQGDLIRDMQCLLARELGPMVSPLRVEVFALAPRLLDGQVDAVWARGQYLTGLLNRKRGLRTYLMLTKLRNLLASGV